MIQPVIESLITGVEFLELFQKTYPLVEQKESEGKTEIVSYKGKGQYEKAFNIDNYNGIGYFRLTAPAEVSKVENVNNAKSNLQQVKYSIRFVGSIKRDQLPSDCAFSDDELCWDIAKQLTGKNGDLRQAIHANYVFIQATRLSTDRKNILSDELPGNELTDINYSLSLIAVDFDVDIKIEQACIDSMCESYHYSLNQ